MRKRLVRRRWNETMPGTRCAPAWFVLLFLDCERVAALHAVRIARDGVPSKFVLSVLKRFLERHDELFLVLGVHARRAGGDHLPFYIGELGAGECRNDVFGEVEADLLQRRADGAVRRRARRVQGRVSIGGAAQTHARGNREGCNCLERHDLSFHCSRFKWLAAKTEAERHAAIVGLIGARAIAIAVAAVLVALTIRIAPIWVGAG